MSPTPQEKTQAIATAGGSTLPFQAHSAEALLSQAIAHGASIDTLERLMALRKEMRAEQAREAFNSAMAAFQAECPVIKKTKGVKTRTGVVAYRYAPIESIVTQVKHLIEKHGFRYTTSIEFEGTLVKAVCRVVHTLGHEEVSVMPVPLGTKTDIMSQSQVVAAASTFAKRYAFLNAFGIMTGDDDKDGADIEPSSNQQPQQRSQAKVQQQQAAQVAEMHRPSLPEDAIPAGKIRVDQTRALFAVWREYMEVSGNKEEDSTALRKAMMKEMFGVTSSTQLTDIQADDLIARIKRDIQSMQETKKSMNDIFPPSPH